MERKSVREVRGAKGCKVAAPLFLATSTSTTRSRDGATSFPGGYNRDGPLPAQSRNPRTLAAAKTLSLKGGNHTSIEKPLLLASFFCLILVRDSVL